MFNHPSIKNLAQNWKFGSKISQGLEIAQNFRIWLEIRDFHDF
jgi:hypothetical protein